MSVLAETGLDPAFWSDVDRHVVRYNPTFVPVIVERAEGSTLYTADGRELIDFTSGQMSAILGHSHPAIVATVREAVGTLDHLFSGMLSRPVVDLSRRLAESLPDPLTKTMLLTTGAESNEAAIRMAKLVTGRHEIVAFSRSWHGMTGGAQNATYSAGRKGYGPANVGNFVLPTPDTYRPDIETADGELDWRRQLDLGFQLIDAQSTGALAACIVEPILSSGGILVPPPGYFAALREHCDARGMLLIFDEAQTALYRTGDRYGFERDGVVPDIITMSKTLGAGLPLAAVVTTDEIEAAAFERKFLFYTTHISDPLVASVGNTVLDVLEHDGVGAAVAAKGELLAAGLRELQDRHAVVGDVRGRGLMQGLEIVLDRETKESSPALGTAVMDRCLELGLHLNIVNLPELSGTFRIAPALTITDDELRRALEILDQSLTEVAPKFV
ncbi:aspartate aminotransferase family protein [Solirubrobacter sp. CPCC 204708]|uniref:Aspartate aminotransferase family protein n=1 Tax=Solirubrobacter deserti TaxID=2282478 RepID=A0ABT4RKK5_9ACTN|nr:aspartate aminotransferase family protein [Solirubrobacter deserti]MBE2317363.1 aspartate aminotransferase family protein [Solirubrobacter deserti]MDA0139092.1 aspartate aminotransferase family protein [Solirubrobacter deserti]